ncbi:MAG TPA: HlyD family efflux transporter periplasmic adaptor subunit, partial [Puia sp.]|nr:HlyD family efflux transporter periplasmic adaptor subunit [Puia sp.]
YREQAIRFIRRREVEFTVLKKAKKTLQLNQYLADNKVISPKEFFDIKTEAEKTSAAYQSLISEQRSEWQSDLLKYKQELSNYQAETKELDSESFLYAVRAPVSGSIQGINARYSGSAILTNEPICIISPECRLMAECYVSPKDVAFLRNNEPARFQIHAFDFNYFGSFTGKITSVDNDYSLIDNKPVFRVRCSFDEEQNLIRKSNFIKLKKGLTLHGRFLINRRPVWKLIFEKMNDWINPSSSPMA